MSEELQFVLDETEESMQKSIAHTESEFLKIRAGKASASMLDGVSIDYYGTMTPINQTSNISTPDPRTITVQPFDKSMLPIIEKAITDANLGLNPQNDGDFIRINVPALTEERRKDLVKRVKAEAENSKVTIRNARKEGNEAVKSLQKEGLAEDAAKGGESDIQDLTNKYSKRIDELVAVKEKEIMTI
jgi:ribosome recycling factor